MTIDDRKSKISFILCNTCFASNLGSAARVMKNMGLSQLLLVRPQCEVGVEARTRAMRGADVLDAARLFPSLEEAAREVDLLVGTSGRFDSGKPNWTTVRTLAEEIIPGYLPSRVGIAFGSEDNGLRREELALCQWIAEIPAAPEYGVLNLAQAVGIMAYELHMALGKPPPAPSTLDQAPGGEVRLLIEDAEQTLEAIGYPTRVPLPRVVKRLQKIAGRSRLERHDVNLFRGLLRHLRGLRTLS